MLNFSVFIINKFYLFWCINSDWEIEYIKTTWIFFIHFFINNWLAWTSNVWHFRGWSHELRAHQIQKLIHEKVHWNLFKTITGSIPTIPTPSSTAWPGGGTTGRSWRTPRTFAGTETTFTSGTGWDTVSCWLKLFQLLLSKKKQVKIFVEFTNQMCIQYVGCSIF